MARRLISLFAVLFLVVLACGRPPGGSLGLPDAGAPHILRAAFPYPQGNAACDAGVGAVCGVYPNGLALAPAPTPSVQVIESRDGGLVWTAASSFVAAPGNVFEYKPGGVASGNIYTSDSALSAALATATGPCVVRVNTSATAPAILHSGVSWDVHGGQVMASSIPAAGAQTALQVQNTGAIVNLERLVNLIVEVDSTSAPAFTWGGTTAQIPELTLDGATIVYGSPAATVSPIQVAASGILGITEFGGGFVANGNTTPFVALGAAAEVDVFSFFVGGGGGATLPIPVTFVSGASGTTFSYTGDASSYPLPSQTAFHGTLSTILSDQSIGVSYNDALHSPTIGAATAQDAIDYLKAHSGSGITSVAGTTPIACSGSPTATCSLSGVVALASGGTGPLSGLTTGQVLRAASATADAWGAVDLSNSSAITNQLPIANLGHGTAGQLPVTNSGATADVFVSLSQDATMTSTGAVTISQLQSGEMVCGASTGTLTCATSASACGVVYGAGFSSASPGNGLAFTGEANGGSGGGGPVSVTGGNGGPGNGGAASLTGGANGGGSSMSGGAATVTGGSATANNTPGGASCIGGANTDSATSVVPGGTALLEGGASTSNASGVGGDAQVYSGVGTSIDGAVRLGIGGVDAFLIRPPTGSETTGEIDIPAGGNLNIGNNNAADTTGTNMLVLVHGTAPTSCTKDGCLYEVPEAATTGGLFHLSNNGDLTNIGEGVSGTFASQVAQRITHRCVAPSLVGIGSTMTCAIPLPVSEGVHIDFTCIGRTTTAGTSGAVTDTTEAVGATNSLARSLCSRAAGGTTTCASEVAAGTFATAGTTANLAGCTLASVGNVPTITLTTASNGAGMHVDGSIVWSALYN